MSLQASQHEYLPQLNQQGLYTFKYRWILITQYNDLHHVQSYVYNVTHVTAITPFKTKTSAKNQVIEISNLRMSYTVRHEKWSILLPVPVITQGQPQVFLWLDLQYLYSFSNIDCRNLRKYIIVTH